MGEFNLPLLLMASWAFAGARGSIVLCDHITDPPSLDPQREFSEKHRTVLQQIYEGLVRLDADGRIEPALAENWRRMDGKTVEFALRRGVEFHDGEPFDAESVLFTLDRYLDPKNEFPALSFIDTIERVEAVDPHTVRIHTRSPDALLLSRLAAYVMIIPKGYLEKNGSKALRSHPVGTGPFRLVNWDRGRKIELEANRGYWMRGYPKIEKLTLVFLPKDQQIDALLSGKVDVLTEVLGTQTQRVAASGVARVVKRPTFYTIAATINLTDGPLKDVRVRRALNFAVNQQDLIRYDQMGNAVPIASLSMPGESGHAPELAPYPYDPARARQLLSGAGYGKARLKLRTLGQVENKRAILILQRQWKAVGVDLEIFWTDDGAVLDDLKSKKVDMALGSCPDPMANAYFVSSLLLYSRSPYSLMRSAELDKILERAVSSASLEDSVRALQEADRLIHDQALSVFTYQKASVAGVRRGVEFTPYVTGMPYLYSLSKAGK